MKALFICNLNQNRSKTAEEIFRDRFETRSAGLYNDSPVSSKDLEWADLVLVMEDEQRDELAKRFPKLYMMKKILVLDVPDTYHYNQPSLVKLLQDRIGKIMQVMS